MDGALLTHVSTINLTAEEAVALLRLKHGSDAPLWVVLPDPMFDVVVDAETAEYGQGTLTESVVKRAYSRFKGNSDGLRTELQT